MGHPVVTHRKAGPRARRGAAVSAAPPRLASQEPRLLPLLLPVIVLGGLAMLHVFSLARLSELESESKRLERLTLEQTMRRGELNRERMELTDTALAPQYAPRPGTGGEAGLKRNRALSAGAVDFLVVEPFQILSVIRTLDQTLKLFA